MRTVKRSDPVTFADFDVVYSWLKENYASIVSDIKHPKPIERIDDFLRCFSEADRTSGIVPPSSIIINNYNDKSIEVVASQVRKYLKAASRAKGFERVMNIEKVQTFYDLRWDSEPAVKDRDDSPTFARVIVAGNLKRDEFTATFMRGVHSMARELDVVLNDRREWLQLDRFLGMTHAVGSLAAFVQDEKLDPVNDALLIHGVNPDILVGEVESLRAKGFMITTTGYARGTVRQNNAAVGRLIATKCIQDELSELNLEDPTQYHLSEKNMVVILDLHSDDDMRERITSASTMIRDAIIATLTQSGLFDVHLHTIDLTRSSRKKGKGDRRRASQFYLDVVEKSIRQFLRRSDSMKISAFFTRYEDTTCLINRVIADMLTDNLSLQKVRLYGDIIVHSLLELMNGSASGLWATCGVDPYYYGRYALRIACVKGQANDRWPEIFPIVLSKDDFSAYGIVSHDRIPEFFNDTDVKLNGQEYGWVPWMRERCVGSYGPDLVSKFVEGRKSDGGG